jgi:hypothetical protein
MSVTRIAATALALCVAACALSARAQDDGYESAVAEALREYEARNYSEAYALFTRAHELRPSARTQRGLGKVAFELRQYVDAVRWLEGALSDTRSPLSGELRQEVEALLGRARGFVGSFVIRAEAQGAEISVDRVPVPGDPAEGVTVNLDLGAHDISVRAPGYQAAERRVDVRGREQETITIAMIRGEGGPAAPDPGGFYRDLGWAGVITGGVLLAGGVVAIAIWADSVNRLNVNLETGACYADPVTESVLPGPSGANAPTCLDQERRYRIALPLAWAGFVSAGVFLATGIGLIAGAPSAGAEVAVACGPFADVGVACEGRF